jgi:hypothetical protein
MARPAIARTAQHVGKVAAQRFPKGRANGSHSNGGRHNSEQAKTNLVHSTGRAPSSSVVSGQVSQPRSFVPTVWPTFCVPQNLESRGLRLRAEINLYKLRNSLNIAGLKRQLDPYAASTDSNSGWPTNGAGGQLVLSSTSALRGQNTVRDN